MQIRRDVSDVPIPGITNRTTDTSGQEDDCQVATDAILSN